MRNERENENKYIRWKTIYCNRIDEFLNEDICNGTGEQGRYYGDIKRAEFSDLDDYGTYKAVKEKGSIELLLGVPPI